MVNRLTNAYYTLEEVSTIMGKHQETIRRWCTEGTIEARKVGGQWYILRSAVDHLFEDTGENNKRSSK